MPYAACPACVIQTSKPSDLDNLANAASSRGDFRGEEKLFRQSLTLRQKYLKKNDAKVISSMEMVAVACREGGKYKYAEALYNQALALWRTVPQSIVVDQDHDLIADNREGLAIVLTDAGQLGRAADIYKQVVARRQQTQGPKDGSVAMSMRAYAAVLAKLNKVKEAKSLAEEADKIMPNLCGTPALNEKGNGGMPPPPMRIPNQLSK